MKKKTNQEDQKDSEDKQENSQENLEELKEQLQLSLTQNEMFQKMQNLSQSPYFRMIMLESLKFLTEELKEGMKEISQTIQNLGESLKSYLEESDEEDKD